MYGKRIRTAGAGGAVAAALLAGLVGAAPQATAAGSDCGINVYHRTFYKNTSFSGTPVRTDCDSVINQSWSGSPIAGMPSNNFSVRWEVSRNFGSGGPFTFSASGTDGVRVYVDGVRKINLWRNTGATARSASVNLGLYHGFHRIRVDYVNWTGVAKVKSTYAPRTSAMYDKTKPDPPYGVSIRYNTSTRQVTASWMPNVEMDLAYYAVYRRPFGVHTWTKVAQTTALKATDPFVYSGTPEYWYEVRAIDKAGNNSNGLDVPASPPPTQ